MLPLINLFPKTPLRGARQAARRIDSDGAQAQHANAFRVRAKILMVSVRKTNFGRPNQISPVSMMPSAVVNRKSKRDFVGPPGMGRERKVVCILHLPPLFEVKIGISVPKQADGRNPCKWPEMGGGTVRNAL